MNAMYRPRGTIAILLQACPIRCSFRVYAHHTAGPAALGAMPPAQDVVLNGRYCERLEHVLALHSRVDFVLLQHVLLALTIAAVVNAAISTIACALPRRAGAKGTVFSLVVAPLCIAVPFLVLDAQRDAMRVDAPSIAVLLADASSCSVHVPKHTAGIRAALTPRKTAWQVYVVLMFAGATMALGARVAFSFALAAVSARARIRAHGVAVGAGPGGALIRRSEEEVQALLAQLRVSGDCGSGALRASQCAICLDDMLHEDLSWLRCTHAYHEACFAKWVDAAPRALCPMCKASAWPNKHELFNDNDDEEDVELRVVVVQ